MASHWSDQDPIQTRSQSNRGGGVQLIREREVAAHPTRDLALLNNIVMAALG